jgi:hypothetical protein
VLDKLLAEERKKERRRRRIIRNGANTNMSPKLCLGDIINTCDNKGSWTREYLLLASYNLYQLKTNKTHLKYYI